MPTITIATTATTTISPIMNPGILSIIGGCVELLLEFPEKRGKCAGDKINGDVLIGEYTLFSTISKCVCEKE
jgi:hypothetical protein